MQNKITNILHAGTNFAQITYTTDVKTAAKFKSFTVKKHTVANVQLFANIKQATQVFANAVKRSAKKLTGSATPFVAQQNWFEHTGVYSIVKHIRTNELYLYAIFNSAESDYTIDGSSASKQQVAALLTPAAADKLLNPSATVYNKTNDVHHTVQVRTIALKNIEKVVSNKTTVI